MDGADCPDPTALDRALAHLEAHLFAPLSVGELAEAAGLSPYHFSRVFSARFGVSVMAHVRARRMQLASLRLSGRDPPTLFDLAFDCGFDSIEGFTRAFKRSFGVSPGRYRRHHSGRNPMDAPLAKGFASKIDLGPTEGPARKPPMRLAGLSGVFTDDNKHEIPRLWAQLVPRLPAPGQASGETFGMACASDVAEGFSYMAAIRLRDDAPCPPGMELKELPAQSYLTFRLTVDGGPLHPQMQAAMREIWGERLPASGLVLAQVPDLEYYPENFEPGRAGATVEFWIPVES